MKAKLITIVVIALIALSGSVAVQAEAPKPESLVGTWAWGTNEVVSCYSDGACVNRNQRIAGEWRYDPAEEIYRITWYPSGTVDVVSVLPGGKYLNGEDSKGVHVYGNRAE